MGKKRKTLERDDGHAIFSDDADSSPEPQRNNDENDSEAVSPAAMKRSSADPYRVMIYLT